MAHLYIAYRCSFCNEIPESAPIYHCPNRHQYCSECFRKLQRLYRGENDGGGCCLICKYSGKFEKSVVNTDFLRKLTRKPGIGRPCRYTSKKVLKSTDRAINPMMDLLSSLETDQGDSKERTNLKTVSSTTISKRPLICLHNGCFKSVAVASLVSHFKHEHGSVPCFGIERSKELRLLFDVSLIEHHRTFCLAMVTVYETNNIDVGQSKSSQSVINTCGKLSGRVPINTFWLMMSGSTEHCKSKSHVLFWLYSNSEEKFWCTLDLSSRSDRISISSFCSTVGLQEGRTIQEVAQSMNCLYISHGAFVALLEDGDKINFRIMLH